IGSRLDARLAALLLEERALRGSDILCITHEMLGKHLGTAREVVSRMLSYFRSEGLVTLGRGTVTLVDTEGLARIAGTALSKKH
ncbi:MAG: Crp/Fnr family transcriptional regulator, partial [Acutalibacteraceae bacterium]